MLPSSNNFLCSSKDACPFCGDNSNTGRRSASVSRLAKFSIRVTDKRLRKYDKPGLSMRTSKARKRHGFTAQNDLFVYCGRVLPIYKRDEFDKECLWSVAQIPWSY